MTDYKKQACRIARQLYGKEVADKIKQAKSEAEISRILITARHAMPNA